MSPTKYYLSKRNNGIYYIGTRLAPTKVQWKSTHCRLKSEALAYIKTHEVQTRELNRPKLLLLSEWLDKFRFEKKGILRERTLLDYKKCITYFIKGVGDRYLHSYGLQDIEQYKIRLMNKGLCSSSINVQLRCIKAIFNYALKQELIEKHPFLKCSLIRVPQRTPIYLSKDDLKTFLDSVTDKVLHDLFLFASLTAMRVSEIVNLRWESVSLERKQIVISNTDEFTTKSGRVRVIPLHDVLVDMLKNKESAKSNTAYVFSRNGYKFTSGYISHRFKYYARLCGLSESYHLHSLRHTCASYLVNEGVSLYVVQNILGHSQISTTQIYSHVAPNTMLDSINKVSI